MMNYVSQIDVSIFRAMFFQKHYPLIPYLMYVRIDDLYQEGLDIAAPAPNGTHPSSAGTTHGLDKNRIISL